MRNIEYGELHSGHPEGKVIYHITELDGLLEKIALRISTAQYWKLKFLICVHDTFKAETVPSSSIESPHSHASLARKSASEFTNDEDLLNMIQYHDLNYSFWKQFSATDGDDENKLTDLFALITDLDLFLHFITLDGSANGKDKSKLTWFIGEVRKYGEIDIDEA